MCWENCNQGSNEFSYFSAENWYGWNQGHQAAKSGNAEDLQSLLKNRELDYFAQRDKDGRTPVYLAAEFGQHECLSLMVNEYGCDPTIPDNWGSTPVWVAAQKGKVDCLDLLLRKIALLRDIGYEIQEENNYGVTPAYVAASRGHLGCLRLLHSAGCSFGENVNTDVTLAHVAADGGHYECLQFLKYAGCKLDLKDDHGYTPEDFVRWRMGRYDREDIARRGDYTAGFALRNYKECLELLCEDRDCPVSSSSSV